MDSELHGVQATYHSHVYGMSLNYMACKLLIIHTHMAYGLPLCLFISPTNNYNYNYLNSYPLVSIPNANYRYIFYGTDVEMPKAPSELSDAQRLMGPDTPPKTKAGNSKFSTKNSKSTPSNFLFPRESGQLGKGALSMEYSDQGTGDFRTPSFSVMDNYDGSTLCPMKYKAHQIFTGKIPMPDGLPGIRCHSADEASTLVITIQDLFSGLEIDLIYVVMHNIDAITRRTVFRNIDQRPLACKNLCGGPTLFGNSTPPADPHMKFDSTSLSSETSNSNLMGESGHSTEIPEVLVSKKNDEQPSLAKRYSSPIPRQSSELEPHSPNFQQTPLSTSSGSDRQGFEKNSCSKLLSRAYSMTMDIEDSSQPFFLTQLSGSWGR